MLVSIHRIGKHRPEIVHPDTDFSPSPVAENCPMKRMPSALSCAEPKAGRFLWLSDPVSPSSRCCRGASFWGCRTSC